jgi:hypothetical protein
LKSKDDVVEQLRVEIEAVRLQLAPASDQIIVAGLVKTARMYTMATTTANGAETVMSMLNQSDLSKIVSLTGGQNSIYKYEVLAKVLFPYEYAAIAARRVHLTRMDQMNVLATQLLFSQFMDDAGTMKWVGESRNSVCGLAIELIGRSNFEAGGVAAGASTVTVPISVPMTVG